MRTVAGDHSHVVDVSVEVSCGAEVVVSDSRADRARQVLHDLAIVDRIEMSKLSKLTR